MALKITDQSIIDNFRKYMSSDETELYYVYGFQFRKFLGATINPVQKNILIGLTNQRLLIMQLSIMTRQEENFKPINLSEIETVVIKNSFFGFVQIIRLRLRNEEEYEINLTKKVRGVNKQGENLQKICDFFQNFKSQKAK